MKIEKIEPRKEIKEEKVWTEGRIVFTDKDFLAEIDMPHHFLTTGYTDFRINVAMNNVIGDDDLMEQLSIKLRKMADKLDKKVWKEKRKWKNTKIILNILITNKQ